MGTAAASLPTGEPEQRKGVPRGQLPQPRAPPPHGGRWREGVGRGLVRPGQAASGALRPAHHAGSRLGAAFPPPTATIVVVIGVTSVGS